jgi:recombinational DNA repair protein (RecF pathway)
MTYKTIGLVIQRNPMGEYNERILLLTLQFGIISVISFGSRSPKSSRRAILAYYDWLLLTIKEKRKSYELISASVYKKNAILTDVQIYSFFLTAVRIQKDFVPYNEPVIEYFKLLYIFSRPSILSLSHSIPAFLYTFSILKLQGLFPYFSGCSSCGKMCSDEYTFSTSSLTYAGECTENNSTIALHSSALIYLNSFYNRFSLSINFFIKELHFLISSSELSCQIKDINHFGSLLLSTR